MSAGKAGIRVRPNVICRRTPEGTLVGERDIARRVSYWELLELSHFAPLLFPYTLHYSQATARQQAELAQFLERYDRGWAQRHGLRPASPRSGIQSVLETSSTGQERGTGHSGIGFIPARSGRKAAPGQRAPQSDDSDLVETQPGTSSFTVTAGQEKPALPGMPHDPELAGAIPVSCALTDAQRRVVQADVRESMVVIAPPGTGKTHVVIERLHHLARSSELTGPDAVVVLSFTRATVAELTRRLLDKVEQGAPDRLRYLTVRTFDSFVTWVLRHAGENGTAFGSHDQRVARLQLQLSVPDSAAREAVRPIRFLIIDEVQDLAGPRACLALQLIRLVRAQGGGVLLLGDPAQSIYQWQSRETRSSVTSFLDQARELLGDPAPVQFDEYHRYTGPMKALIADLRHTVQHDPDRPDGGQLVRHIFRLGTLVPRYHLADLCRDGIRTAVLTRTNLQVHQMAQWCTEAAIPHYVNPGAQGSCWPGWIARLTEGFEHEVMDLSLAERRWSRRCGGAQTTLEEALSFLRTQGVVRHNLLHVAELGELVRQKAPLTPPVPDGVSLFLSTIHKAKGLEYDRVLVLEPEQNVSGRPEEVRLLYVAATRARNFLRFLSRDPEIFPHRVRAAWAQKLEHDLLYDRSSGSNYLVLDGTEEIDASSLRPDRETNDQLWQAYHAGCRDIAVTREGTGYVVTVDVADQGPVTLGLGSRQLAGDLNQTGHSLKRQVTGLSGVRLAALATISVADCGRADGEQFGVARLALAPVLQGKALVRLEH